MDSKGFCCPARMPTSVALGLATSHCHSRSSVEEDVASCGARYRFQSVLRSDLRYEAVQVPRVPRLRWLAVSHFQAWAQRVKPWACSGLVLLSSISVPAEEEGRNWMLRLYILSQATEDLSWLVTRSAAIEAAAVGAWRSPSGRMLAGNRWPTRSVSLKCISLE